jgi:DNA-binding NarL/FixJ family response regulator
MENLRIIRIALADHQLIFRDGMKSLLDAQPDFAVVGEAGSGTHTLRLVRELHPDVLVLDMAMPGGGLSVLKKLSAMPQPVRAIALAPIADREMMMTALQHGARGVIGRESTTAMLFKSIRTATTDQYWIPAREEVQADAARDGHRHRRRRRRIEQGHRRAALAQRGHGQASRVARLRQARRLLASRAGGVRDQPQAGERRAARIMRRG